MPYKKIPQQSSEKKNIYPNKLMGQNFLRDKNVLNKIVAAANLTTKDNVLEIGPGLGVLTRELAKRAGRVVAVEKDRKSAQKLK
ncbi:MAG: Ribosomal RNA small subunit methyltransferase A, partial [Parcubacteria group bacterium GW2011_GWA2_43_9b]